MNLTLFQICRKFTKKEDQIILKMLKIPKKTREYCLKLKYAGLLKRDTKAISYRRQILLRNNQLNSISDKDDNSSQDTQDEVEHDEPLIKKRRKEVSRRTRSSSTRESNENGSYDSQNENEPEVQKRKKIVRNTHSTSRNQEVLQGLRSNSITDSDVNNLNDSYNEPQPIVKNKKKIVTDEPHLLPGMDALFIFYKLI